MTPHISPNSDDTYLGRYLCRCSTELGLEVIHKGRTAVFVKTDTGLLYRIYNGHVLCSCGRSRRYVSKRPASSAAPLAPAEE